MPDSELRRTARPGLPVPPHLLLPRPARPPSRHGPSLRRIAGHRALPGRVRDSRARTSHGPSPPDRGWAAPERRRTPGSSSPRPGASACIATPSDPRRGATPPAPRSPRWSGGCHDANPAARAA